MAKYITTLVAPLVGLTTSYVKNLKLFVKLQERQCLLGEERLVSFKAKSSFANISVFGDHLPKIEGRQNIDGLIDYRSY